MYIFNTKFYTRNRTPQIHFNRKQAFIKCLLPEKLCAESQPFANGETEADPSHTHY